MSEEKVDANELARSLTGFDEIAISKAFGADLETLPGTVQLRALLFVKLRRDKINDREAVAQVMKMPLGDIKDIIVAGDGEEEEDPGE